MTWLPRQVSNLQLFTQRGSANLIRLPPARLLLADAHFVDLVEVHAAAFIHRQVGDNVVATIGEVSTQTGVSLTVQQ